VPYAVSLPKDMIQQIETTKPVDVSRSRYVYRLLQASLSSSNRTKELVAYLDNPKKTTKRVKDKGGSKKK
jgi:hypothetical protein